MAKIMPLEIDEESDGIAEVKQVNKIQPHIAINDSSDIQLNSFRDFLIKNRGYILFALTSMLLIYRNNLQPLNFLIVIILFFWAIIRLIARTTIFSKGELSRDKPSLKRKTKIFSLVISMFITFIIVSSTLFLNFSPQVGGDSLPYEVSPNFRDGTFHNLNPTDISSGNVSFLELLVQYIVSDDHRSPNIPLPTKEFEKLNLEADEISITWLGHSTLLIHTNNVTIITDPIFGEDNMDPLFFGPMPFIYQHTYELQDLPEIDYVFISHDHYDHLDMGTIKELEDSEFFVPLGVKAHLLRWGIDEKNIEELDWYDEINISSELNVALTPSQHFSGRGLFNGDTTLWASWVFNLNDKSIFFSGDSGYMEEYVTIGEKYGPFDIAFLESGQYNEAWNNIHMFPEEVIQAGIDLNATTILPIHNSKYELSLHHWDEPLERVTAEGERRNLSVATPMIGESFVLGKTIPNRAWWTNVSDGPDLFLKDNIIVGVIVVPLNIVSIVWIVLSLKHNKSLNRSIEKVTNSEEE
jgi:L-ascorbate metabolism protein UlaG (beta-lactamase superfamily)